MKFIMHLTIQNIKRRRVRTILTLLGVMIGVVAVVSLLSLGMGVKRELLQGYGDDASRLYSGIHWHHRISSAYLPVPAPVPRSASCFCPALWQ